MLLPVAAVVASAFSGSVGASWSAATSPVALSALKLTLISAAAVTAINAVMGTLIAWVLVRDSFPGQRIIDAVVDLPFALPTVVAGLTLVALYGPDSPLHLNLAYTSTAVFIALLFVTLPFVVRSVQPVIHALDTEMEEAAVSLGASSTTTFRRIVLPNLLPSILSGTALAFARAVGEYGSVVLLASNIPFKSQVMSVFIFGEVENGSPHAAAAASVLLLVISLAVLLVIRALARVGGARR
ncbi:MAG: sulfate ABC transporter permease subunit CysT [Actinomycetota bacterium]|nr:sulfate ABC transporter permease subunit CysT [Actinomycetota bacterium]